MAEKKVIQIALDGDIEKLSAKIRTIQSELSKLSLDKNLNKEFEETFYSLTNELKKIQNLTTGKKVNFIDVKKVEKSADVIDELYDKILRLSKSSGIESSFLKNDKKAIDALTKARASYNSKTSEGLKEQQRLEKKLAEAKEKTNSKLIKAQAIDKTREETSKRLEEAQKELASLEKQLREKGGNNPNKYLKTDSEGKVISADNRTSLGKRYNALKEQLPDLQKEAEEAEKAIKPTLTQINEEAIKIANNITKAQKALDDFNKTQPQNQTNAFKEVRQELEKIDGIDWKSLGIDLNSINSIDELNEKLSTLSTDAGVRARQVLENIIKASSEGAEPLRALGRGALSAGQDLKELTDREKDIQRLTYQLKYFFSITNSVRLFKRAVRSAFQTVKELDSAMTKIAVVSDFSVGDMWERLPEFTAQANELGVAIKDTYNATALYIQQGLDLQHSMELSNETLKMARIAGIEAADATDAMTSALRGFNMELNQTSAQRVNDVYSELAAITASNVEELSTAMSKTASIAHSVNMEFETTAAFLAQGIETTRESAETIGTMLKTVIGRFSEVKSLYSKGEITGTDEDGEEINVNKVQKALRTAGVDMTKFFTGEEGLDQVFLNLSKKWDSLDITTQRYIATLAAGSRQQSRFLAIISDYSKTMELVNAANNSAGASQEQYEKTLDSLASKLAKFKNAWDEFAMGLANNEIIKVAVDTLTTLLQTINKILDTVSGGSGILKSTLSILTAIGGLKLGKSLLFTGIGKIVDGRGGGLAGSWLGKKKEQQNTGYSAGIQTGKGFINGFESITRTFKSKGGKGFVQSIFSAERTVTDFSKDLDKKFSSKDWKFDFSNAKPAGLDAFKNNIVNNLSKGNAEYQNLGVQFNKLWDNGQYNEAMKVLDQAHIKINMTGKDLQNMGVSAKQTVPNFQAMAIATGAAAAALMGLASLIEPLGEGGEDIAVILRGLASTMMGLIPIILMVQAAMVAGAKSVSIAIKNIPIIGWIAAIISAVISLIQVISHFVKKNSTEEKTKDLIEATQAATEAAKEAKQAYDDLLSSKSKYTETQEALQKLVAGTDEWRQSLFSANQQVLDLISQYSILQDHLTIGENGVLSIDEVGWRALTDSYQQNMVATQQASFAAQARQIEFQDVTTPTENERSKFLTREELNMDAFFELIQKEDDLDNFFEPQQMNVIEFANSPDIDEELRNLILKKYGLDNLSPEDSQRLKNSQDEWYLKRAFGLTDSNMNITYYSKEAMQFLDEFGDITSDTVEQIKKLGNAGLSTAISITKAKLQIENNLKQSALAGLSNKALQMEGETGFASFLSKQSAENYQEDFDKRSEELSKKGGIQTFAKNNKLDEKYDLTLTGDNEKDAAALYEALYKEEVPDGKDLDWMIEKITDKTLIDDLTNGIENLTTRYENADKETQDFVKGIASNGQKMIKIQLESADTSKEVEEKLKDTATKLGYSEDEIDKFISDIGYDGLTLAEVSEKIANQFAKTSDNFDNALTESKAKVGSVEGSGDILNAASDLMSGQTYEVYSNYLDKIVGLMIRGGVDAANGFQTAFGEILDSSGADRQKIIELMSNYDLSNYDDVKAFIEELEKIVPATEESEGQLEQLETALINLGKATKKVDLKSAMSNLTESLNLADEIESRDKSEGITQEELEKIVASGARDYSDFIFTGQEFVPVQDSMSDLANAIRDNTDEVIKNTLALLEESIAKGEQIEQRVNNEENWTGVDLETKNRILSGDATEADAETIKEVFGFENSDTAEALERYRTYITDYLNLADNRAQEDAYKDFLAQSQAFQLDPQEQLDQGGAYLKERVEAEQLTGVQDKLIENYNKTGKAVDENSKLMQAHTVQYAQSERKIKSLCETVKDVKDAFDAGTEALKNNEKPSEDYYKALEKIAERGKQVFGESFTKEFVEENADLISQLSEGGEIGEQAFISLQQKISEATQQAVEDLTYFDTNLQQVKSVLDGLDGVKAEFKVNGTADVSQLVQQLILAGNTAAEAARIVESLTGSTVTYTVDWQWVTLPTSLAMSSTYAGLEKAGASGGFTSVKIPKVIQAVGTLNNYSGSGFSSGSSGGGSGGSSSKEKVWENPYDKLYNLTEEINEALRRREALEREYDRILERRGSTFKEIRANYNAQLSSLEHELKLQKQLQEGRKEQLDAIANERYTDSEGNRKTFAQTGATRYARYDQNLNRIIIDWDAIDMITDDDLGSAVEAYVSRLEELQDQFEEVDKTVEDMQDTINELKKSQMQDYLDFEQSVYDALVNAQQKLIDEYQSLSDSIADSNSKILDNLQESIDLERQIRDNTKTEEDINEKEARLAFLRRDTSNANALEIKQLEEELSDARQDYSDSLIDQQLDRLSKQNDDAQEAREKQIELMQAQLDYASENGEFWNQAYELINDGFSSDGSLNQASQLWDLLKADQGWNGLSKFGQLNWQEEISKAIIAASQGYANWNMYKAEQVDKSLVLPDGTQLTYDGTNWKDSQGNVYKDVDFNSNKNQFEYGSIDYVKPTPTPETGGSGSSSEPEKKEISIGSSFNASGAPIYSYPGSSAQRQYFANDPYYVAIGEMGDYWMARWHGASSGVTGFFKKSDVRAYKTGGLADFTGPAWLDGSKTKPELVLNARDTENFLLLKDVLGSFLKNNTTTQNGKGGDNYYDIDISVDEIGSDYDVDQLARRIKEQITEDSTYRNVNAINFIR